MTTQSANLAVHDAAASADAVLPDRRDLALLAVEKTRMPMVVSDARQPDNPIVLANQAFLDLTGYTAGEIIGRNCRFMQGPETSQLALAQIRDDIVNRRDSLVEILNYRKDGSTFWISSTSARCSTIRASSSTTSRRSRTLPVTTMQ